MELDGKVAGTVGASLRVTPALHTLSIRLAGGLEARYDIDTRETLAAVQPLQRNACVGDGAWEVRSGNARVTGSRQEGTHVTVESPEVVFHGFCPPDLANFSCAWRKTSLVVRSEPELNAVVWVNGIASTAKTATVLELQLCDDYAMSVEVVLHKDGYVPCRATWEEGTWDAGRVELICALHPQQAEAAPPR